jgi:hypothetical protein
VRTVGLKPAAAKALAGSLAVLTAIAFVVAGVALLADASLWEPVAIVAWLHVPATLFEG